MVYSRQLIAWCVFMGTCMTLLVMTGCKPHHQMPEFVPGNRITIHGNCRLVGSTPLQTPQLRIHGIDVAIVMHENKTIFEELFTRCHTMMEITGIVDTIPSTIKPNTTPLYRLKLVSFKVVEYR